VTRAKQEEFLALLEPVYDRLWRFALATARNRDDANDLMSETILATYERFHTIRNTQAFTSFLFTVATRLQRQKERRARWFSRVSDEDASSIEASDTSDALTDVTIVREAIASLPAKQREAVTLFDISGFSLEEVRAIQGGTLSGVKSRLRRGRLDLARKLGANSDFDDAEEARSKRYGKRDSTSEADSSHQTFLYHQELA
jgi:RNA polymerase sigma-70 factor (ECF subfamily)